MSRESSTTCSRLVRLLAWRNDRPRDSGPNDFYSVAIAKYWAWSTSPASKDFVVLRRPEKKGELSEPSRIPTQRCCIGGLQKSFWWPHRAWRDLRVKSFQWRSRRCVTTSHKAVDRACDIMKGQIGESRSIHSAQCLEIGCVHPLPPRLTWSDTLPA